MILIHDLHVWADVEALASILEPISQAQYQSEADSADVGHVLRSWRTVEHSWNELHRPDVFHSVIRRIGQVVTAAPLGYSN